MTNTIKLSSPATRQFWEIPVLFEDEHLLALDKPSGLLASPNLAQPEQPSLISLLHAGIAEGKGWAQQRKLTFLRNTHRLDAEASGVLLLAKSKPTLIAMANLFGAEKPVQRFVALVAGAPPEDQFQVDAKLTSHPTQPGRVHVNPRQGKQSRTRFVVLEKFSRWTLMQCEPVTGRTHQVRVHLRFAGLPVVGDELYGGKPLWLSRLKRNYRLKPNHVERPLLGRAALHAESLTLPHPVTGETVTMQAKWPKDLAVAIKYLRQYAMLTGPIEPV
jgi:RluA family pseudouridine synthase